MSTMLMSTDAMNTAKPAATTTHQWFRSRWGAVSVFICLPAGKLDDVAGRIAQQDLSTAGHGGLIFFLADTALAHASIRPGGAAGVTTAADVVFSQPASLGSRLVAGSRCVHRQGRREVHDVRVIDGADDVIALVRGQMVHREPAP